MSLRYLQPGDRPDFIEGWHDLSVGGVQADVPYLVTQSLCRILNLSHQAVERLGESYRGFRVGAAVLALDSNLGRTGIYFGGNYTPFKGAEWNCAEKRAFEVVRAKGFTRVLGVAVSGPAQPDSVSGIESPTLHPCHRCRGLLATSDLVNEDTLVATTNLAEDEFELFTVKSLLALHDTGQPQPFPEYHPLLPAYWNQILSFDADDERAEMAILEKMATAIY